MAATRAVKAAELNVDQDEAALAFIDEGMTTRGAPGSAAFFPAGLPPSWNGSVDVHRVSIPDEENGTGCQCDNKRKTLPCSPTSICQRWFSNDPLGIV